MTRDELLEHLAEQHRPRREPYRDAVRPGLFTVQCPACDGSSSRIWASGDPEYACDLWRAALDLGVVT
jgi:hypothetical protein